MKLTHNCYVCKKPAVIKSEFQIGKLTNYVYECGHIELREKLVPTVEPLPAFSVITKFKSPFETPKPVIDESFWAQRFCPPYYCDECQETHERKHAYEFQRKGIEFVEKSNFNTLIADAMGLGKTIQGILSVTRNPKLLPCLILVKGSMVFQFTRELREWYSDNLMAVMPIMDRVNIIPGFNFYVMSKDLLYRKGVTEKLLEIDIKCIILDEVQDFKDPSSSRTIGLIKYITAAKIQHKIALSGTPIKNRATEYFTILNLLAPEYFTSMKGFCNKWLEPNEKGIYTKIASWKLDEFRELTQRWIIRREKHEVLKNLPPLKRDFQFITITDPNIKKSYNSTLDLFQNYMNGAEKMNSTQILGWLAKLRHITGLAKVPFAIDWTEEFLNSSEDSLCIGFHHNGVRDLLYGSLTAKGYDPLKLSGEDDTYRKDRVQSLFNSGANRLLELQMISGGVGLNLQSCANALVLERCWSSADEEQFESRFHRNGQVKGVNVTYMVAEGTIDHWFHDIVGGKRVLLNETLSGGKLDTTQDENVSQMLRDLAEQTLNGRLR